MGRRVLDRTEELLKKLTEAPGVPGYESQVRQIIREALPSGAAIEQDRIGSIIARLAGDAPAPRVVVAAHMDEIGFMVRYITEEGFIKFIPLGGWWDQVVLAQRVVIKSHKGDIVGIVGAKPPHLLAKDERGKLVEKREMYIDIGATSAEEVVEAGVRLGDPIVPVSQFTVLANPKTYMCKAWDDRVGCGLMIQLLHALSEQPHPNTLYGVGTVMEEVGLRGARTTASIVSPDVAIVLDSDIAGDVPGIKKEESDVKMGGGPTLLIYDAMMIPNLKLRDMVIDLAAELDIPLQLSAMEGGATDGGFISLHKEGVPTVVIGVPARHIHSHDSIIHRDDYDRALTLLTELMKRLDAATVAGLSE